MAAQTPTVLQQRTTIHTPATVHPVKGSRRSGSLKTVRLKMRRSSCPQAQVSKASGESLFRHRKKESYRRQKTIQERGPCLCPALSDALPSRCRRRVAKRSRDHLPDPIETPPVFHQWSTLGPCCGQQTSIDVSPLTPKNRRSRIRVLAIVSANGDAAAVR